MATVIRMQRAGGKNHPFFRVVVTDSRKPRDGKFLEKVGYYNPVSHPVQLHIDQERVEYWVSKGARPSESVAALIKRLRLGKVEELSKPKKAEKATAAAKDVEVAEAEKPAAASTETPETPAEPAAEVTETQVTPAEPAAEATETPEPTPAPASEPAAATESAETEETEAKKTEAKKTEESAPGDA